MLEEGKELVYCLVPTYRVDIKLTQTNDIGMLLNAISTIEISKQHNQ